MIALRKAYDVITDGTFEFIHKDAKDIFAYKRENGLERLYCINNFSEEPTTLSLDFDPLSLERLSHNYEVIDHKQGALTLKPYESIMLLKKL